MRTTINTCKLDSWYRARTQEGTPIISLQLLHWKSLHSIQSGPTEVKEKQAYSKITFALITKFCNCKHYKRKKRYIYKKNLKTFKGHLTAPFMFNED